MNSEVKWRIVLRIFQPGTQNPEPRNLGITIKHPATKIKTA
jgi:hypothetical protein